MSYPKVDLFVLGGSPIARDASYKEHSLTAKFANPRPESQAHPCVVLQSGMEKLSVKDIWWFQKEARKVKMSGAPVTILFIGDNDLLTTQTSDAQARAAAEDLFSEVVKLAHHWLTESGARVVYLSPLHPRVKPRDGQVDLSSNTSRFSTRDSRTVQALMYNTLLTSLAYDTGPVRYLPRNSAQTHRVVSEELLETHDHLATCLASTSLIIPHLELLSADGVNPKSPAEWTVMYCRRTTERTPASERFVVQLTDSDDNDVDEICDEDIYNRWLYSYCKQILKHFRKTTRRQEYQERKLLLSTTISHDV